LRAKLLVLLAQLGQPFGLFTEARQFLVLPAQSRQFPILSAKTLKLLVFFAQPLQFLARLGGRTGIARLRAAARSPGENKAQDGGSARRAQLMH
jgi:hypothetical protein